MYKGINAVGDFAKKAWKYTPLGLASSGISNAWNWLTKKQPEKQSKIIDKQGIKKTGEENTGLQKVGNIGKTLFKYTPIGLASSGISNAWNWLTKKQPEKSLLQDNKNIKSKIKNTGINPSIIKRSKDSDNIKSKIKNIGINPSIIKRSKDSDNINSINKLRNKSTIAYNPPKKIFDSEKSSIVAASKHSLINPSNITVNKMKVIESQKLENLRKEKEEAKMNKEIENKKFDVMPQLITIGIASYFDKHKLKMDLKTGQIETLPLGIVDAASKI